MFFETLRYSSIIGLFVAALWAIPRYTKVHTTFARGVFIYVWFQSIFELISILTSFINLNNKPWFYLYCLIEAVLIPEIVFSLQYMKTFVKLKRWLQLILVLGILIDSILSWPTQINAMSRMGECLLLSILSLVAFLRLVFGSWASAGFILPDYWFLLGVIITLMAQYFIVHYINYSETYLGPAFSRELWLYNTVSVTISNLLISVSLWVTTKPITLKK